MNRDEADEVRRRRGYELEMHRILEALEAVIMPMGGLAFRRGIQAWAAEPGFQEMT